MKNFQIAVEILITGVVVMFSAFYLLGVDGAAIAGRLGDQASITAAFLMVGAFIAGFVVNTVAEAVLHPVQRSIVRSWLRGQPGFGGAAETSTVPQFEPQGRDRSMARLAGNLEVAAIALFVLALTTANWGPAMVFAVLALASALAFRQSVVKGVSRGGLIQSGTTREPTSARHDVAAVHPSLARLDDGVSMSALIFAGGTAFRNCNIALARRGHRVTRVVPSWDNGGSSRTLREGFHVLSIGDIRHALMTMAHGENISNEVIRLFNCRLSEDGSQEDLCAEMESFLDQKHPRMAAVAPDLRNVILKYLETFWIHHPTRLDLHNGSIGNFVMLGAYLSHGNDMNTAIYVFRQLCGINGNVWPITLANDLQLCAQLANGEVVVGEENVTDIERPEITSRIEKPIITRNTETRAPAKVPANPLVLENFGEVDVIVLGPGSFFSSVLPHLMIDGVVDALAKSSQPKIFVGNMREGNECYGWSVSELVELFLATCHEISDVTREDSDYLTHIVAHDSVTHSRSVRGDSYLETGDLNRFKERGIKVSIADLEDPWKRGAHDANILANYIIDEGQ